MTPEIGQTKLPFLFFFFFGGGGGGEILLKLIFQIWRSHELCNDSTI